MEAATAPYRVVSGEFVRTLAQHVWPFGSVRVSVASELSSGAPKCSCDLGRCGRSCSRSQTNHALCRPSYLGGGPPTATNASSYMPPKSTRVTCDNGCLTTLSHHSASGLMSSQSTDRVV